MGSIVGLLGALSKLELESEIILEGYNHKV